MITRAVVVVTAFLAAQYLDITRQTLARRIGGEDR